MYQILFSLGLCPRPRWGSLQCSPLQLAITWWFCQPPASQAQISASHMVRWHNRHHRRRVDRCLASASVVNHGLVPDPAVRPPGFIYLVYHAPFRTGSEEATVPAVPASTIGSWHSLTCISADSGRWWRTSLMTVRGHSSKLTTMPSIGFRPWRRKHMRNETNSAPAAPL